MPLGRIEIEQLGGDRWVAEVEAGGTSARRVTVRAVSFDEIIGEVIDAYRAFVPADPKPRAEEPLPPTDELAIVQRQVEDAKTRVPVRRGMRPASLPTPEPVPPVAEPIATADAERDALIARAEADGIEIDRRWGLPRLREALRGDAQE